MWPFPRKKWEKLGSSWTNVGNISQFQRISPNTPLYDFRDPSYRAIPHAEFEKLLFDYWFPRDFGDYAKGRRDCDKYAVQCMAKIQAAWADLSRGDEGLDFGYISGKVKEMTLYHAWIWQMDDKGDFAFYEPQTGQRWSPTLENVTAVEA